MGSSGRRGKNGADGGSVGDHISSLRFHLRLSRVGYIQPTLRQIN